MRILVSVENDLNLDSLKNKICAFIESLNIKEVYIDIFHVHTPISYRSGSDNKEIVETIEEDEFKLKLKTVAHCENEIESFIQEKLDLGTLVNSFVLKGDYKKKLKEHIIFQRYDLLILNPSKKSDYDTILNGRNTHWIIDNLEIPVLIMPSYIEHQYNGHSDLTCFVESLESFNSIKKSEVLKFFKSDLVKYIHFGRKSFHDEVEVIHSSSPLQAIKDYTVDQKQLNIYTLHHKNQGDFLNFIDKSFTKNIIKSLANPLLIF